MTATLRSVFNFGSHALNGGSGGSHAVGGSGGEAVGSMVDANDEVCGKSFLLFLLWPWTVGLSGLKGRAQRQEI